MTNRSQLDSGEDGKWNNRTNRCYEFCNLNGHPYTPIDVKVEDELLRLMHQQSD
jgi:hypothetical protein